MHHRLLITEAVAVHDILAHLGEATHTAAPDAGPWPTAVADAGRSEYVPHAQPVSDYKFDQRIAW